MARIGIPSRVAAAILVAFLTIATAPAAAAAGPESFLVPGTRAPIVIAGPAFTLTGILPDGSPNPRFGRDGFARAPLSAFADLGAEDATTQADGRIVVSGYASVGRVEDGSSPTVAVARFRPSGAPDRTFGDGGVLVTGRGGQGSSIVTQRNGGLLVGVTRSARPTLMRLRPDGSVDRSYGWRGVVVIKSGWSRAEARAEAVAGLVKQPRGGATVAIDSTFDDGRPETSTLARLGPRGRLDRRFGDDGVIALDLPGLDTRIYSLAATGDGGLIVLCTTDRPARRVALVRLRSDGGLDRSFGRGGIALGPEVPDVGFGLSLSLERDGGAAVAATAYSMKQHFELVRFTREGRLRGFGGPGGGITAPVAGMAPYSMATRPNGAILVLAVDVDPPHGPLIAGFSFDRGASGIWTVPDNEGPE